MKIPGSAVFWVLNLFQACKLCNSLRRSLANFVIGDLGFQRTTRICFKSLVQESPAKGSYVNVDKPADMCQAFWTKHWHTSQNQDNSHHTIMGFQMEESLEPWGVWGLLLRGRLCMRNELGPIKKLYYPFSPARLYPFPGPSVCLERMKCYTTWIFAVLPACHKIHWPSMMSCIKGHLVAHDALIITSSLKSSLKLHWRLVKGHSELLITTSRWKPVWLERSASSTDPPKCPASEHWPTWYHYDRCGLLMSLGCVKGPPCATHRWGE